MDRITTSEAAAILGCTQSHLRHLHRQGKLKAEKPSPRVLLFDRAEVEAYAKRTFPRGWRRGRPRKPADAGPPTGRSPS
jgi:excisionase family DNA binding protein